jgi:hypothetical protein
VAAQVVIEWLILMLCMWMVAIQISAWRLAILTDVFHGVPLPIHAKSRVAPQNNPFISWGTGVSIGKGLLDLMSPLF